MSDNRNSPNNQDRLSAERDVPPWLQPVPDEEEPQSLLAGKKIWIMGGVAVTVVALFVAVIFALYDGGASEAPRHIAADTSPVREKPDDPGGMDVPYQDKQVFERASGDTLPDRNVALGPEPEEPVEQLPVEEDSAADDPIGDIAAEAAEPAREPEVKEPEPAPAKVVEKTESKPAPAKTAPAQQSTPAGKGFLVQLGAYGSEETAEKAWRTIRGKYGNFLSGLTPSYEAVKSGGRTLYRLRVGPLATRAAADEVCLGLRAQQQACIVVNP